MILGPDGYWRTMEFHNGELCSRVVRRGEPLLPEVDLTFDGPHVRISRTNPDEIALADLTRRRS